MKKRKNRFLTLSLIIIFILVIIFILMILLFPSYVPYSDNNKKLSDNTVTRIIDGDTFELYSGEIVRLLCIDTPEKNNKGFENATIFLENSILNKQVRLESLESQDKDKYNRLLRFVYVNNTDNTNSNNEIFINKEIINKGYGTLFVYNNTDCSLLLE